MHANPVAGFNQFFDDANLTEAWRYGGAIDEIDAAVAGLGGCPYAPGASGQSRDRGRRLSARDFGYCVFGEVVEGMVDQIRKVPTKSRRPHEGVPVPRS